MYEHNPLAYKGPDGKYAGLSIEILEHIASKEQWELEYLHGTWPECLQRLEDGEIDLQVLIGYTAERDRIYDYNEESIFVAWGQIYIHSGLQVSNILDLEGKTIALYKDSLLSTSFKKLLQEFKITCNIVEVENYIAIAEEIKSGRADAGVFNRSFAGQYGTKSDLQKTPIIFSPIPIYYAVPEGQHKDLIEALDAGLSRLKTEENSIYYRSIEKYFGGIEDKAIPSWVRWALVFISGAFIVIGLINILLKRQVKIQTEELLSQNKLLEQEVAVRKLNEVELAKWGHIFTYSQWGIVLSTAGSKKHSLLNNAYAEMHGYTMEELMDKDVADILVPSVQRYFLEALERCYERGHYTFEGDHLRKDGTCFPAYHDIITIKNENDQELYTIVSVVDMSNIKAAEEEKNKLESQLRQAYKMEAMGTLAGGIAHDFNNILSAIIGFTEMAKDGCESNTPVSNDLEEVLEACDRAKGLVQQILVFSRQEETKRISLQPSSIVKQAINMLRPSLPTTINIKLNINAQTGPVYADPIQVHQILMNLSANAFHAMEKTGGDLDISLKEVTLFDEDLVYESDVQSGSFVQLSVGDSGSGIAPEVKEKIFDPYFTTKKVGKGTGMGLAMVHGIVKSYGGFISFYSEVGEGTVFHVFLPVTQKGPAREIEDVAQVPTGTERILFVDDEEMLTKVNQSILEKLGYHVTIQNSSLSALELFRKDPELFDVVITDQTMPHMTGSELSKHILQVRADIPIILCTGYSTIVNENLARAAGIREFALKPLTRMDIAKLIRNVLDVKKVDTM